MLRLVRKYTFIEAELVEGLQEYRPPFGPKTEVLPGKTEALYTDFLSCLDDFTQFEPQSVLCDYEKGLHNAILTTWPSTSVRGCFFSL